ncbi:MAG: HigA family addiction module antitoxin [Cyclobacteriaceae bacterium]
MLKPVHPGRIIREDYMEPLELTMGDLATALGVTRQTMVKIVNGKSGISPEMALRLSEAFDTTPDLWLGMQKNYDLSIAREKFSSKTKVKKLFVNTTL